MVAIDRTMQKLVDRNEGTVSREIFCNQDVYDQEMQRVFLRSWLFVGHESQVPKPGDFVLSRMGEEAVIVTRDKQNRVHVLLNSCRHRGNKLCLHDRGKSKSFTCSFHGWSYDSTGALVALPYHDGGYSEMAKEKWGLASARVETFEGSIWATWDKTAPSFVDYLGGSELYLRTQLLGTDGSEDGAEVLGGLVKWRLGCNWKVPCPDVDRSHGWMTHKSLSDAFGVGPTGFPVRRGEGGGQRAYAGSPRTYCVAFPEGHTMGVTIPSDDDPNWGDAGVWADKPVIREYLREKYEIRKRRLGTMASLSVGPAIFPNEGWLGRVIRIMHPQGPLSTEIWTYFFVDRDAPQEVKDALSFYYERWYGPGGMTQQDDMENWYNLTIASKGPMARTLDLNYQMRLSEPPIHGPSRFGLPGLFTPLYSDENHRRFYQRWAEFMEAKDWDELSVRESAK
ncbi:MAG: Rieske 2Fe-2S domain-containing protein [Chloroflexi bacterium]|nr:Rieske 2Fe-2S domain-containing protein [Chloroflexota bacterium]